MPLEGKSMLACHLNLTNMHSTLADGNQALMTAGLGSKLHEADSGRVGSFINARSRTRKLRLSHHPGRKLTGKIWQKRKHFAQK